MKWDVMALDGGRMPKDVVYYTGQIVQVSTTERAPFAVLSCSCRESAYCTVSTMVSPDYRNIGV